MFNRGWVLLIVGMLIPAFRINAQSSITPIEWNSRRLTLQDYVVSEAYSDKASNSSFQWSESTGSFRSLESPWLKIKYTDIRNSFIPSESWIRADARNVQKLKYEQLKFDLSEFYCRKVESEVFIYGNPKQVMNEYSDSLSTAIKLFSEMTNDGENGRVVDSLTTVVSNQLMGLEMPCYELLVPEKKRLFFVISLYEQCLFRLGDIARLLPGPAPFIATEITAGYGRFGLSAGLSCQQTGDWLNSKEAFTYKNQSYPAGARCEDVRYYGLLEYVAVDKPRF